MTLYPTPGMSVGTWNWQDGRDASDDGPTVYLTVSVLENGRLHYLELDRPFRTLADANAYCLERGYCYSK